MSSSPTDAMGDGPSNVPTDDHATLSNQLATAARAVDDPTDFRQQQVPQQWPEQERILSENGKQSYSTAPATAPAAATSGPARVAGLQQQWPEQEHLDDNSKQSYSTTSASPPAVTSGPARVALQLPVNAERVADATQPIAGPAAVSLRPHQSRRSGSGSIDMARPVVQPPPDSTQQPSGVEPAVAAAPVELRAHRVQPAAPHRVSPERSPESPSTTPQPGVVVPSPQPRRASDGMENYPVLTQQQVLAIQRARTNLLENLLFPVNREGGNAHDVAVAARRQRPLFLLSPNEREVNRINRSGRQLSELDVLNEKHEPEFRQITPAIADALLAVVNQHTTLRAQIRPDPYYAIYDTHSSPAIELEAYIHRVAEYTYISPAIMLGAMVFLDRLLRRHPKLFLTLRNAYKLFFVAARVASKVVDLRSLNNKCFASVGGITNKHLNDLEARFLVDLHFDLFLSPGEFQQYAQKLQPHSPTIVRALTPSVSPPPPLTLPAGNATNAVTPRSRAARPLPAHPALVSSSHPNPQAPVESTPPPSHLTKPRGPPSDGDSDDDAHVFPNVAHVAQPPPQPPGKKPGTESANIFRKDGGNYPPPPAPI